MTTRAEEIAGEVYPDSPDREKWPHDERAYVDGMNASLRAAFVKGYKQGQQDRWISVDDKVPDYNIPVLVHQLHDTTPYIASRRQGRKNGPDHWWADMADAGEINGDAVYDGYVGGTYCPITHWMHLPSPPNPEQR